MNLKQIGMLGCIFLAACGAPENDFTIKNKPALPLPDINYNTGDSSVTKKGAEATITAAEAADRSRMVFSGKVQTVDSMIHGVKAPFYYIGVKVNKVWKGEPSGRMVYYISRYLQVPDHSDMIFFLSGADSTDELISANRLRWEWTAHAPYIRAQDSAAYLTLSDSFRFLLKSAGNL